MLRVALTGGIATGKSHCARRFQSLGAPVVDADALAHQAIAPGTAGLAAVRARFGAEVMSPSGEIDRAALGRLVFADPAARRDLEGIVHPVVYTAIERWFATEASAGARVGIAEIPVLYETRRAGDFDRVIVATCPAELQQKRLRARGLTDEDAARRLAAQLPVSDKARLADYVIDTSGTFDDTDRQVTAVWERLSTR